MSVATALALLVVVGGQADVVSFPLNTYPLQELLETLVEPGVRVNLHSSVGCSGVLVQLNSMPRQKAFELLTESLDLIAVPSQEKEITVRLSPELEANEVAARKDLVALLVDQVRAKEKAFSSYNAKKLDTEAPFLERMRQSEASAEQRPLSVLGRSMWRSHISSLVSTDLFSHAARIQWLSPAQVSFGNPHSLLQHQEIGEVLRPDAAVAVGIRLEFSGQDVALIPFIESIQSGQRTIGWGGLLRHSGFLKAHVPAPGSEAVPTLYAALTKGFVTDARWPNRPLSGRVREWLATYESSAESFAASADGRSEFANDFSRGRPDSLSQMVEAWARKSNRQVIMPMWPLAERLGTADNRFRTPPNFWGDVLLPKMAWSAELREGVVVLKNALAFIERPRRAPVAQFIALQEAMAPLPSAAAFVQGQPPFSGEGVVYPERGLKRYFASYDGKAIWTMPGETDLPYRGTFATPLQRAAPLYRVWEGLPAEVRRDVVKATVPKQTVIPVSSLPAAVRESMIAALREYPTTAALFAPTADTWLQEVNVSVNMEQTAGDDLVIHLQFDSANCPRPLMIGLAEYSLRLSLTKKAQ
jgi:hypothetical protein